MKVTLAVWSDCCFVQAYQSEWVHK